MRTNIFVAGLLFLCSGCTSRHTEELTQQQKDQIKNEVKMLVDSMVAKDNRLDAGGAMRYYWDSPEFMAFNADGTRSDYQTYTKAAIDQFNSFASLKLTSVRQDFVVLSKDIVICAFLGKAEVTLKSGDKVLFDPDAVMMVFKKIAGEWKIVSQQESATIVTQKAVEK
jgi:hypothetical protein